MNQKTETLTARSDRKPRISLFLATAGYAGYSPKAPGTWGSLVGVLIYWLPARNQLAPFLAVQTWSARESFLSLAILLAAIIIAFGGVVVAGRVAKFSSLGDPQFVVIDEVSGQILTVLFALAPANWKYLALGFILFRVFDIWKPFPVRQAESLPAGWGIMADDWVAAVYAAMGIWIARTLGF